MSDDRLQLGMLGLGPDRLRRLVAERGGPGAVLGAIRAGRLDVPDRAREAAELPAAAHREALAALGVEPLFPGDGRYPQRLAEQPDAPGVLFVRGSLAPGPGVAVVGTRRCTRYGRALAHAFGRAIAGAGWPLVSGLARGIDGAAHRGTVAGAGVGVAVLGSGIDVWYPREHRALGEALLAAGGAVVSESPPGFPPEGWRFPLRNRIIAALAAAVVVVEANVTGGALITALLGAEQGREVFAVPGDVDREASRGCNLLIRDGAHPVLGADDLVAALSLILGPPAEAPRVPEPGMVDPVLAAIDPTGTTIDTLLQRLGWAAPRVLAEISRLESKGLVHRMGSTVTR